MLFELIILFCAFQNIKKKAIWLCSDTVNTVQSVNKPDIRPICFLVQTSLQHHAGQSWIWEKRHLVHAAAAVSDVLQKRDHLPREWDFWDRCPSGNWWVWVMHPNTQRDIDVSYLFCKSTYQYVSFLILADCNIVVLTCKLEQWRGIYFILFAFVYFLHFNGIFLCPNNRFFSHWLVLFIIYLHYCPIQLSFYQQQSNSTSLYNIH